MSRLLNLLENNDALIKGLKVRAPETLLLRRAVDAIRFEVREINLEATGALQDRVASLLNAAPDMVLRRSDLRESCKTFLSPPRAPGRDEVIGSALIDQVKQTERRAALFALLDAYLDGFSVDDEDVARLSKSLRALTKSWPWREGDPWPDRITTFSLLNPDAAPKALAKAVLSSEFEVMRVLDAAGLSTEGRRTGGLAEAAFCQGCANVAALKADASIPPQNRLMQWAGAAGALRYPRAWPDYANALFKPWSKTEPVKAHKALIMEHAMSYAGDPRINVARWRPVKETMGEAYATLVRWLTQASVRQFFDIVDQTMTVRPDMWAERRKFWTQYLDADLISAAWVAFGSDGAALARRAAARTNDKSLSMFGKLASDPNRSAQHAALIMRIGDLTIVEWSHNGKWNIWSAHDKLQPALFRHSTGLYPDYDPSELMNAPTAGPHMSRWQHRVAQIIRDQTGLRP